MRGRVMFCISALIVVGALFTVGSTSTRAAVPDSVNYQGILRAAGGSPVPDGSYSVTFKIYDVASGINPALWTETKSVSTVGGLFTTFLGSATPLPASVFTGPNRWLGIAVSPDPEITPRSAIVAVPYAYRIATVDGAVGGTISGDVSVSGGNFNLGSSTATSGNIFKGGIPFIHDFGTNNTFIGRSAGNLTMTGGGNTASGSLALTGNTSGRHNTATGDSALLSNTGGSENTASGFGALLSNTVGGSNTATGWAALGYNIDGNNNTATGLSALGNNSNGSDNTAIGTFALIGSNGSQNTACGSNAMWIGGDWVGNTACGYYAMQRPSGNDCTAVGAYTSADGDNCSAIGAGASVIASNTMVFGSPDVVRWGFGVNAAAGHAIEVGTGATNGNGAYLTTGGVWTNTSDRNVKEGITLVDGSELLHRVDQLPVYRWNYKGENPSHQHVGPMAQDFQAVFGLGDDDKHISTIDPAGVALAAIQALNQKLNDQLTKQTSENEQLHSLVEKLSQRVDELSHPKSEK